MPLGEACASAELAARGGDVAGFLRGSEEVVAAFAEARQWMEALAEG